MVSQVLTVGVVVVGLVLALVGFGKLAVVAARERKLHLSSRSARVPLVILAVGVLIVVTKIGVTCTTVRRSVGENREARREVWKLQAQRRVVARARADAAMRPPVLRTDVRRGAWRGAVAFELLHGAGPSPFVETGPQTPRCDEVQEDPRAALVAELKECIRYQTIAIVRPSPEATGAGFSGDALVYDLENGSYLGGVVLEVADDRSAPLGERVTHAVRYAVTGRAHE